MAKVKFRNSQKYMHVVLSLITEHEIITFYSILSFDFSEEERRGKRYSEKEFSKKYNRTWRAAKSEEAMPPYRINLTQSRGKWHSNCRSEMTYCINT